MRNTMEVQNAISTINSWVSQSIAGGTYTGIKGYINYMIIATCDPEVAKIGEEAIRHLTLLERK